MKRLSDFDFLRILFLKQNVKIFLKKQKSKQRLIYNTKMCFSNGERLNPPFLKEVADKCSKNIVTCNQLIITSLRIGYYTLVVSPLHFMWFK